MCFLSASQIETLDLAVTADGVVMVVMIRAGVMRVMVRMVIDCR